MSKDLWIAAEEAFSEEFFNRHQREPTEEELSDGMVSYFSSYLGTIADRDQEAWVKEIEDKVFSEDK